ncbi:MAG: hypothetical protein COA86_00230 [Kangiella sp.]|nr:MAG: hypothetical protein COA86_00230 [Kangiella sp.]
MNESRVSPRGLYNWGNDFIQSALIVCPMPNSQREEMILNISIPAYYLLGHGLELLLKSYLLSKGESIKTLRNKYGHDLDKLFDESIKKDIQSYFLITNDEITLLKLLNFSYSIKELEYFKSGTKKLPKYSSLCEFSLKFAKNIEKYINEYH